MKFTAPIVTILGLSIGTAEAQLRGGGARGIDSRHLLQRSLPSTSASSTMASVTMTRTLSTELDCSKATLYDPYNGLGTYSGENLSSLENHACSNSGTTMDECCSLHPNLGTCVLDGTYDCYFSEPIAPTCQDNESSFSVPLIGDGDCGWVDDYLWIGTCFIYSDYCPATCGICN